MSYRMYTVGGFTGTLPEVAKNFDINYVTLMGRLRKGIPLEEAIKAPVKSSDKNPIREYTIDGFTGTLPKIAEKYNISYNTLLVRINRGMSLEEAINTPVSKVYTVNGFKGTLPEIASRFGIKYNLLLNKLKKGISLEDIIGFYSGEVYVVNGFSGTLFEIASKFSVKHSSLLEGVKKGIPLEEIINSPKRVYKNRVYTVDGFSGTLPEVAERFGIKYGTLLTRLRRGFSLEEALDTFVVRKAKRDAIYTVLGFKGTLHEIADRFGIKYGTLVSRLCRGLSLEEAIISKNRS